MISPGKACTAALTLLLFSQAAFADAPEVKRNVGQDGVPVISIKSDKAPPREIREKPVATPSRKAFKVYELQGDPAPKTETKVVVLSSPPPIAPNNYNWGWGWGYPSPYFNSGYFGNWFFGPIGFQSGFYQNYQNPPVNYQNPPLNYQNRPLNYQNPPANFQPFYRGGFHGGFYPGGRCR